MTSIDKKYAALFAAIQENGEDFEGRNGGTRAIVGEALKFKVNLKRDAFPIIACRRQNFKHYLNEFLWEVNGGSNVNDLNNKYAPADSSFLWSTWADDSGYVAYSYGEAWRANSQYVTEDGMGFDQLSLVEDNLKNNPMSRRITLITADVYKNILDAVKGFQSKGFPAQVPPCHPVAQFTVNTKRELSVTVLSRSQDLVCGLPGDIIRYSLMVMCLAKLANLELGNVTIVFSNVHYYKAHEEKMIDVLSKPIKDDNNPKVTVKDGLFNSLKDFTYNDFNLYGYSPNPFVSMPLIA